MLKEKDLEILGHLRTDARQKMTAISKETGIPVTTVYDRLRAYRGVVDKYTALMNFSGMGYSTRLAVAIRLHDDKVEIERFLQKHPNINNLYRLDSDFDFLAEFVFKDIADVNDLLDEIRAKFPGVRTQTFNLVEDMRRESFLPRFGW